MNKGTMFKIMLPIGLLIMRPSILILEDDRMTRESLGKALSDSYVIHSVGNGIERRSHY